MAHNRTPDSVAAWQRAILNNRAQHDGEIEQLWQRLAGWYDKWVQGNDYVQRVMPRLRPHIGPRSRVLEIGPGTGAFTLPLAQWVEEVVAFEPSAEMAASLQGNLQRTGVNNVGIIQQKIEDLEQHDIGSFDLALASHSLYNVLDVETVMKGLIFRAKTTAILMGAGDSRPWFADLHRRFKGKERPAPAGFREFYPLLLDLGIFADVEILRTSSHYIFDSFDDMMQWWALYLDVSQDRRSELEESLRGMAQEGSGKIGIFDSTRVAFILVERERNLFTLPGEATKANNDGAEYGGKTVKGD